MAFDFSSIKKEEEKTNSGGFDFSSVIGEKNEESSEGFDFSSVKEDSGEFDFKGLSVEDIEKGKIGYNNYLLEIERQKNAEKKEDSELKWWERAFRAMGSSPDTTAIGSNLTIATEALREDTSWKEPMEEWSDEQRYTFGYYYDTYGIEAAEEYAASINNSINLQKEQKQAAAVKEESTKNPLKAAANTVGAIASSALGGGDFLYDLAQKAARGRIVSDGEMSPYEWSQAVTGGISEHLNEEYGTLDGDIPVIGGKGWGDVYGIGTSIGQSMATAYALGGTGTLLTYFGSSAASGIDDAKARGASDEQAIAFGIMSGFAEAIPEMLSTEKLLKIGSSKTFKELMLNIVKQSGAEGIEEGTTSIINNFADNIIMGDFSNFNILVREYVAKGMSEEKAKKQAWKDIVEGIAFDSLAGAFSGGVSGGIQTGIQSALSAVANEVVHNKPQTQERAQTTAGEVVAKNATTTEAKGKASSTGGKGLRVFVGKGNPAQDIQEYVKGFENATKDTPAQISSMYDPADGLSAENFARGVEEAYRFGTYSYPIKNMEAEGTYSKDLPSTKRLQTYYIARNNAEEANIAKAKEIQKKVLPGVKGDVVIEGNLAVQKLTRKQNAEIKLAGALAEITGVKTHVFASYVYKGKEFSYTNSEGDIVTIEPGMRVWNNGGKIEEAPNGWDDIGKHEIWADINAGSMGQGTFLYTLTHEYIHNIKPWSAEHYNVFVKITAEAFERSGKSFEEAVAKKYAKYKKKHSKTTLADAQEEVVAETMSGLLRDKKGLKEFSNQVYKQDRTLWEKIKDWFKDVIAAITNAYKNLAPESEEARMLMEQKDLFEQAQKVFAEAVVTAGQNYKAYSEMAGVQIDKNTDSVAPSVMFSERTWSESEYVRARTETARAISRELNVSLDQAYDYIDSINGVARLIADDRVRLDYEPNLDENATVLKPNSEYGVTVDMSTLCAKRLLTTGTFDAIQKRLPDMVFDSEDIVKLRKMMMDRGYEVACGICYVESTRREMGRITQEFIDRYKIAQQTGKPIARVNASGQEVVLKSQGKTFMADKEYTPNLGELNTTDIDYVKRDHPEVYNAYLAFMNARGQAKPKLLETRAEYKGEILKQFKKKDSVEKKNREGGLRLQSFSDFELPHLIDMMQIVMDMSRVGLKSQAYTKVPKFAEAFGGTGVKINLSLIAKGSGLDANGNLIFDDVEGIDHNEAFRIREKFSKNVGTILVGKNDAHIIAAMADPRIDMIIPFHKSSWKESLYEALGLTGYENYTEWQHERDALTGENVKHNFYSGEYWDDSKTGDENAQIYLQKCRNEGRIPVFPQFQNYPGYWKLLIDFKMYDNDGVRAPHEVVKPIFDNEYNAKILDEYKGGHRKLPVAQDVVDDFVKEYDTGTRFQDRDSDGRELSKEQAEFFKDSKARDAKGRLLTLYHGSDRKVTAFDPQFSDDKTSLFFTSNYEVAHSYTRSDRLLNPYAYLDENSSIEDIAKVIEEARPYYSSVKTIDAAEAKAVVEEFKNKSGDIIDAMQGFLDASEGTNLGNSFFAQSIKSNLNDFKGWLKGEVTVSFNLLEKAGVYSTDLIQNIDEGPFKNPEAVKNALQRMADVIGPIYERFPMAQAYEEGGIIETTDKFGRKEYLAKSTALKRANYEQTGGILPVYANIINPLIIDAKGKRWNQIEVPPEMEGHTTKTELLTRDVAAFAHDNGYDGVIFKNLVDMAAVSKVRARKATVVVAFDGKQIKSVDNKTPTSNPDIRFSDRDYSVEENKAVMSKARIDYLIEDSGAGSRKDYAQAWITSISPTDYINLTTDKNSQDRAAFDKFGSEWDPNVNMGNYDYLGQLGKTVRQTPYLAINVNTGKVVGHDGRHRIRALEKEGIKSVEIMVELRDEDGRIVKYEPNGERWETIKAFKLINQFGTRQRALVENLIPLNEDHRTEIEASYGEMSTKGTNMKYSDRYWEPTLDKDEWRIINYVVENHQGIELADTADYFYRNYKGKKIFGIYSTVDNALLYAVHEDNADKAYNYLKQYREEYRNGNESFTGTEKSDSRLKSIWLQRNARNGNNGIFGQSGKSGENASIYGGESGIYADRALRNVLKNLFEERQFDEGKINYQERLSVEDRNRVEILENKVKRLEGELKKMEANAVLAGQMSQGKAMAKEMRLKAEAFEEAIARKKEQIAEVRARRDELLEKAKAEKADAVAKVRREARDRLEKRISDVKAQKKEQIDALRKRHEEKQGEIREKYRDSIKKATEGRHRTLMRAKIKRVVGELNTLLTRQTKEKHVPLELQKPVAAALDMLNLDDQSYYESRIRKLEDEIASASTSEERHLLEEKLNKVIDQRESFKDKISGLKEAYKAIGASSDPYIFIGYNENIAAMIDEVSSYIGDTLLRDMSMSQLKKVYNLYRAVLKTVRDANKLFAQEKATSVIESGINVIEEIEKAHKTIDIVSEKGLQHRKFFWNNLKPVYAFRRIGSETLQSLFGRVRKGEDTWATDIEEAKKFSVLIKNKYGYKTWDFKKTFEFSTNTGRTFKLDLQQMMSLYAYSKRDQAYKHLTDGGFVFDDKKTIKKHGKEYHVNTAVANNISVDTLQEIVKSLTVDQRHFVDEMQTYLSEVMGEKGNEVSRKMYDIELFVKEESYFPLKSSEQFLAERKEVTNGMKKLVNSGFTKPVTPGANNPIILSDFIDVWANHVNDMSMYHAFVLPIEDFNKVYSVQVGRSEDYDSVSVKSAIQNKFTSAANSYIKTFIEDINGGARVDSAAGFVNKLLGNWKKAKVFASASVVIQQPSAIARAFAEINPMYFIEPTKISSYNHRKAWEQIKKYAPVAVIKEMGYFDADMGQSTVDYIKDEKTFMDRVDEFSSFLPALADEYTWSWIWDAVKRETKARHKDVRTDSDEFLKICGERFTEIVVNTQVYDSVLSRSANMRSKDIVMKMLTAFQAEPTTSANMVEQAFREANRGNKKKAGAYLTSVAASVLLNAILVSFVYAARDDDDEEKYLEKYAQAFTQKIADGFNPLTYLPLVKDVFSIFQGYKVERTDLGLIQDLFDYLNKGVKKSKELVEGIISGELSEEEIKASLKDTIVENMVPVINVIASMNGIPLDNLKRDLYDLPMNVIKLIGEGQNLSYSNKYFWDMVGDAFLDQVPFGDHFTESKEKRILDGIKSGDEEYLERLKGTYTTEKGYYDAVRKAIKEAYLDGDFLGSSAKDYLIRYSDKGKSDAENIISSWEFEKKYGFEWSERAEAFASSQISEAKLKKAIMEYKGVDEDDAEKELKKIKFKNRNGFDYGDKASEYRDGNITKTQLRKALIEVDGMTEEEADIQIKVYDLQNKGYTEVTISAVKDYYEFCESEGISEDVYYAFFEETKDIKGDYDSKGESIPYSKTKKIMPYINKLPITAKQKTAIAKSFGWSDKTIAKYRLW